MSISSLVLRAHNVPRLNNVFGLKLFVTVASQATEKKTQSVPVKRRSARWGDSSDSLGDFILQPSAPLILRLCAGRFARRDILIGTHEMIPVESQADTPFVLTNGDRQAGESIQLVTLYLTIDVSPNTTFDPILPIDAPILQSAKTNDSLSGDAEKPSVTQDSTNPTRSTTATGSATLSPPTDRLPSETSTPILPAADRRGVSPAESALHGADESMTTINLSNTWERALSRIKWVMDTVSPVAEVCVTSPFLPILDRGDFRPQLHQIAKMAHGLLIVIPKTLLEQFQRDDNVQTLLVAVHDAFDFANQEDRFKAIGRDSRQAQILTLMLQHRSELKNTSSRVDKKIEDFRSALLEQRKAFLDEASITTEITALQILDDVGIISNQLHGMATQLKWVSSQASDAELDAKIREIPYGHGSRFTPDRGCLPGTRTAFLDFIDNWVNDPASERCLVILGQAGTGKAIKTGGLPPLHDSCSRSLRPLSFGKVVKDNSSFRAGTRDYGTLFESLILEPLKDLHIVGPILVATDALDESGDATGRKGLHTFLAQNLIRLPLNFRVLITSRPEDGIGSALDEAQSVKIKYMNDSELAVRTHDDILAFLREDLSSDEFRDYGVDLAIKVEGLFQWAAVASQFILDPPGSFSYSRERCINHLLKVSANREGQDPLDELYKEVLEGYFTDEKARSLFRSVVGQLITSIEPLSIRSLTTLRRHSSDGNAVVILFRRLGIFKQRQFI
ncbi:hypothetical protein EDB87DRAFT_1834137 [Lactarius vividus]|nr:hypothetical protein EDB87DRAFT_1834137 [Lactarius vividus]